MRLLTLHLVFVASLLALPAFSQSRPYIGYAYPAGGCQGATVQVKLGGQGLEGLTGVFITGDGITARVVEFQRALNNQEASLLGEQLRILKKSARETGAADMMSATMMSSGQAESGTGGPSRAGAPKSLIERIEQRTSGYVNQPATAALAHIGYVEVSVSPDATPGQRELRLRTVRGISNPLPFYVGQLPENTRPAMRTSPKQILGKEHLALRKRPAEEVECAVEIPRTLNGQIASGEINRYRFKATKGQKLVISAAARQLVPFIADAVPGWFQPVLRLTDTAGKEVAFCDDHQFHPDPVILCEAPYTGEYLLEVYDAIYRGREDFVYRITIGEVPFLTSIFPLGGSADSPVSVKVQGWNIDPKALPLIRQETSGACRVTAANGRLVSNPLPFELTDFPDILEQEGNDTVAKAQRVNLPIVINGHIDKKDDWDVFRISGKSNQVIVAEVRARRFESPLDSIVKVTDASGRLLAHNDDAEDPFAGENTHNADSYVRIKLPADGAYYVHIGDTARNFGPECAYRLHLRRARPDFELRAVPSSLAIRSKGSGQVTVHVERKDGFAGPIKLSLANPPDGFTATPVSISSTSTLARLNVKTTLNATTQQVDLAIVGAATVDGKQITRQAVPAEDRMQAFLWRHLVPATSLATIVFDPSYQLPPKRVAPELPKSEPATPANVSTNAPKFTKSQVAGRLRQLKFLYEEDLLTDEFYLGKVAECASAMQN